MKKILIAIPEGFKFLQIEVPDEIVSLIKVKAVKDLPNGMTPGHVGINETINTPQCPNCKSFIKFMGIEDGEEIHECKCGSSNERKPEIKN